MAPEGALTKLIVKVTVLPGATPIVGKLKSATAKDARFAAKVTVALLVPRIVPL